MGDRCVARKSLTRRDIRPVPRRVYILNGGVKSTASTILSLGENMRAGKYVVLSFVAALVIGGASAAEAQQSSGALNISVARLDYDLSGTGSAAALGVRTTRDLSSNVRLEVGALFAKPEQQFGPATLFIPEAQLQYRWNMGHLTPYVGGGIGASFLRSDFGSDWAPTLSAAVGTTVRLTRGLGVTGGFRLRGHEWRSTGTSAGISAGLSWTLPSF
jgi:hypothetical protein